MTNHRQPIQALQRIYLALDNTDSKDAEGILPLLEVLFPHANLTLNLYLATPGLPGSMPQVQAVLKAGGRFLTDNLFCRMYVHLVHPAAQETVHDITSCYRYLKRTAGRFDQEGYMHQEVPRLMLLPVVVPDRGFAPEALATLLRALKGAFLLPSVYLNETTFFAAGYEGLQADVEKVYHGPGNSVKPEEILCDLFCRDILEDSCCILESGVGEITDQCPAGIIASAGDLAIYACVKAFREKSAFLDINDDLGAQDIMAEWRQARLGMKAGCLECRRGTAESFAGLPLPETAKQEVGALLYHFGTLYQDAGDPVRAIVNYRKSLEIAPAEEAGATNFRMGLCHMQAGDFDQALEAFHRAESTYRDYYYWPFYIGFCHFNGGDYRRALEYFAQALHMDPQQDDLVNILVYIGTCYNSLGEYDKAVSNLERARESAGGVKEIYSALGFSYFHLKEYDTAIENLNRAVELDPCSAIDYASLGSNYREKGDVKKAMAMYEKALELDPQMTPARENLERLKDQS